MPLNVLFCQGLSGGGLLLTSLCGHELASRANEARSPSMCTSSPSTSRCQTAGSATSTWIWWAPSPALGAARIYSPSLTALRGGRRQFRWPPPRWWTVGGPCSAVGWRGLDCQPPSPRTEEHSSLQLCGHLSASCWAPSMCRLPPAIQRETGWWSGSIAASRTPYVPTALVLDDFIMQIKSTLSRSK